MTRPIYEPSLTRTDAALEYGTGQLFRRPSLVSGTSWAWIRWETVTVTSGVSYDLFDDGVKASTFDTSDAAEFSNQQATAIGIQAESSGLFIAWLFVDITGPAPKYSSVQLEYRNNSVVPVGSNAAYTYWQPQVVGGGGTPIEGGWTLLAHTSADSLPGIFNATLTQSSGVNRTINEALMRVWRIA